MRKDYEFVFLLVVRSIACSTFLYREVAIIVQGSQLATMSIRECCYRRDCQPAHQPVEYAYPQCVRFPKWLVHGHAHLTTPSTSPPPLQSSIHRDNIISANNLCSSTLQVIFTCHLCSPLRGGRTSISTIPSCTGLGFCLEAYSRLNIIVHGTWYLISGISYDLRRSGCGRSRRYKPSTARIFAAKGRARTYGYFSVRLGLAHTAR